MAEKPLKFETEEVKVLRGFENKKIDEYELDGWELVSQKQGKLRTTLNFRRPKKPIPMKNILGGAALVLIGAISITFASLAENENAPAESSETKVTQEATPEETPAAEKTPEAEPIMTVENNEDLATLLSNSTDNTYTFWAAFYEKYKGRTIEFDGNIALMEKNPDFKYTYDVLIEAGQYSETSSIGAPFRALRVVVPFGWKKTNQDDVIVQGTNVRVVATIRGYNEAQTFDIWLVSTTVR